MVTKRKEHGSSLLLMPLPQPLRNLVVLYLLNSKANLSHISFKLLMRERCWEAIFNPMILESIKPLVLIIIFTFSPLLYIDSRIRKLQF
jgi:hypothetical protein